MSVEINIEANPDSSNETEQRLKDIRSMMDAGHKSIRLEKHSLIYWGITGGLLCTAMPFLLERLTDYWTTINECFSKQIQTRQTKPNSV